MNLEAFKDKISAQVQREYNQGLNHVRNERERKRDILKKVLPIDIPAGEVKVNLLWKNIQLENALFLTDEITVDFNSPDGVIGREFMENAKSAARFDYEDMDLYEMNEDIVNQNALYGLSATIIDGWDDEEKQPLTGTIDPLSIIPDPQNWRGNKMRFIGFERRVSLDSIKGISAYKNVDKLELSATNKETSLTKRAQDSANNVNNHWDETDGLVDIYDHFTVFDGKKWLTTWANDFDILLRAVEIEGLTEAERLKPSKVKFPVQLHRRKPKYGSFFGVSIADEILNFQDVISVLTNLQVIQARIAALGPDKFVDQNLGIDASLLGKKLPGGRIIPVRSNGNIGASFFTDVQPNPSQFPTQVKQELKSLSEETTGATNLAFGQSAAGSQTKAEVQTLMQNTNQQLNYIASNYLRGQKAFWESWYRSYALNMGSKDKKVISLYQHGNALSKELRKQDFISDGKVQVYVTSKSQENAKKEKDYAKLIAVSGLFLPNMKPGYALNSFLRKIGDSLGVDGFDSYKYVAPSVDEEVATQNLELLNRNVDVSDPEPGEDLKTYIEVYKMALDTPAKWRAIEKYRQAYFDTRGMNPNDLMQGQSSSTSEAMAMNTVNSMNSNPTPSTAQVTL